MAIIPYVNIRSHLWATSVTSSYQFCQLPYSGFIINPIPAIGTVGSFVIRAATVTPPDIFQIPAIKKGDRLRTSDGYTYYATEDVQAVNESDSITIPVTPAMQAAHANQTFVVGAVPKFTARGAQSVIWQLNPQTKTLQSNGSNTKCVPYLQDWPWSADPNGIPWDQANLWMLSFVAPNFTGHRDTDVDFAALSYSGASQPDVYAVPKTIGTEYTPQGPRYLGINGPAAYPGGGSGYYSGVQAFRYMRTNTAIVDRNSSATYPDAPRWLQMRWRPVAMKFQTGVATSAYSGLSFTTSSSYSGGPGPSAWGGFSWPVVGSRGGYCSIAGFSYSAGSYSGITLNVYQENPGFSPVLLASFHVNDGHNPSPPVTTGTWSAVVLPTTPGTAVRCYWEVVPDIGLVADVRVGGYLCVSESTQVPWCCHVVTGNKVAPGGLIAPFY